MKTSILVALLAFPGQVYAKDSNGPAIHYSNSYQSCSDKAGGSYTLIIRCENQEQAIQDRRLNQTYIHTMQRLSEKNRLILRNLERQWISERDNKCATASNPTGLSDRVDIMLCRLNETISRTEWLKHY